MKFTAFAAAVSLTLPLFMTTSIPALAISSEEFVEKAAISDMFEIQSGKLAAEKAENEDVREFGEQMVDDHTETSEELKELVKDENLNVQFPTKLDQKHQSHMEKLKKASGGQFDRLYVPMQVLAHEQAVNLFEGYVDSGDNKALKEWAADTLPDLKEHWEEARDLNAQLSKPDQTAAADDEAANDRALADKVTEETDVKGKSAQNRSGQKSRGKPNFEFVTQQQPTDWSAQALIGRAVYNPEGDSLGDINNVILNEKGDVVAVTIGIGGFLGIGEKYVGVPFDALQFKPEEEAERQAGLDDADRPDATGERDAAAEVDLFDSEHGDIRIVLNATKDQLEAAPDFVWLGERDDKRPEMETNVE